MCVYIAFHSFPRYSLGIGCHGSATYSELLASHEDLAGELERIANEDEREHDQDIAKYVDEINELLKAIGMSDKECDAEAFVAPSEEDEVNVIITLFWVTNEKATLTLSFSIGRWKKC